MSKKDLLSQCREALGDATLTNLDLLNLIGEMKKELEQGRRLNADYPQIQPGDGRFQGIQSHAVRWRKELYRNQHSAPWG